MLNNFENRFPGTQYSILRFFEELKPYLKPKKNGENKITHTLHECKNCKEPTEKTYCKTCEMIQRIKKEEKKTKNKNNEKDLTHLSKYNKKLTCHTTKNK